MTKLELLQNEIKATKSAMAQAQGAEAESLSEHLDYLREKEIDVREAETMHGEDDEAELEMYDDESFDFRIR